MATVQDALAAVNDALTLSRANAEQLRMLARLCDVESMDYECMYTTASNTPTHPPPAHPQVAKRITKRPGSACARCHTRHRQCSGAAATATTAQRDCALCQKVDSPCIFPDRSA